MQPSINLTLIAPTYFLSQILSLLNIAYTCIQEHFILDFIMEANTKNPDQTSVLWEQSDLNAYCLSYNCYLDQKQKSI